MVFDSDGAFQTAWGSDVLADPHAVYIAPKDEIYVVDRNMHQVLKFDAEGKLLLTLGERGQPSDTGYDKEEGKVKRPGLPFNRPTDVAVATSGEIYISDGYRNCRVHRFSPEGKLIRSWGEPGTGPAQFNLPHSVWVDREERIIVADRENDRIQLFTLQGKYITEWGGFLRPTDIWADGDDNVYVSELGNRVSILQRDGKPLARFGSSGNGPGQFYGAHGVWGDPDGNFYISEVLQGRRVQKFIRKS
jgi:DNA-binding beta-propeller fold protein YncE